MLKRILPYLIVSVSLALLVGGFLYLRSYAPKYTWHEQLTRNNKQPYGTSFLFELTKESLGKENFHELKNPEFDQDRKSVV